MKKKFILLMMIVLTLLGGVNQNVLNAQNVVSIGEGSSATYNFLPCYTYYNHSVAQQIYTAEELAGLDGNIISMSFQTINQAPTRTLDVYLVNTDKDFFVNSTDMVNLSVNDRVFSGSVAYTYNGWTTITFDTPFEYTGKNLLLCVNDHTGTWVSAPANYVYNAGDECRAIWYYQDNNAYDLSNINNNGQGSYKTSTAYHNNGYYCNSQIRFTYESSEPGIKVDTEAIALGTTMLGTYWNEKETPSASFEVKATQTTITSISCDNDFFTLSYDMTANPIVVNVTYNKDANVSGLQEGTITISAEGVENTTVTVSATAYAPVTPDVIELAQDVEFTVGAYANTPDFATLHDDYNLPKEVNAGNTPDAVYHFTMEKGVLTVNVAGTNAIAAIYKAEDLEGSGPMANNNYKGIIAGPSAPTTFFYDFAEESSLEDFNTRDDDGDGRNWEWVNDDGSIISFSWNGGTFYPQNYIFTKEVYAITETSKLIYRYKGAAYPDNYAIVISEDGVNFEHVAERTVGSTTTFTEDIVDLSEHAGKVVHIGLYHYNSIGEYYVNITELKLTDGSDTRIRSLARNAEPQINGVLFPAGEYYLVAAAEDEFSVTLKAESVPAPEALTEMAPANGATEQSNPKLSWTFGKYTEEYQVLLGTTNPPTEVVVDWSSELATSFQTEGLANQTTYYWQVNTRNTTGTTTGEVYSFSTPLNQATELAVTDAELYPGETTTLTWTAAESAISYNIYVNEVLFAEAIEGTSFELTNLPHNVNPGNAITVTAVHTSGESAHSEAVNVKMAGTFNLVVNVKDTEGNAIENAAVAFNTINYYDEYYQLVPAIDTLYTDADGKATQTLALPCEYASLAVNISKEYANVAYFYINSGDVSNGVVYVKDITLEYVGPEYVETDKGIYVAGEDMMVLTWNKVEGAIAYNIYKQGEYSYETYEYEYTLINTETITDTTFTVETLEYDPDSYFATYAVSAVYSFGESAKTDKWVEITGKGLISGTVTDGTNPIEGAVVAISYYNEWSGVSRNYTTTTAADGSYKINALVGEYDLTVTRYDYKDYSDSGIESVYGIPTVLDIVLEQNAVVEFDVTAVESGEYVNVSWTAPENATSYNLYRRDSEGNVQRVYSDVTSLTATDYYWSTLENGTYEYGVSAFSEGSNVIFEEDFENNGWTNSNPTAGTTWKINPEEKVSGDFSLYLYTSSPSEVDRKMTSPEINVGEAATTLKFQYLFKSFYNNLYHTIYIKIKGNNDSDWYTIYEIPKEATNEFTEVIIPLAGKYNGDKIQLQFFGRTAYFSAFWVDDIAIVSETTSGESKINWSAPIEKLIVEFTGAEDSNWDNAANWNTNEVPTGKNVNVKANAVISSAANVKNLNIASGKLTIDNGGALTVTGTITNNGSLVLNDGAQLFQSNENVYATFDMEIVNPTSWENSNKDGWQFIASPFNAASVMSFTGFSWAPKSYDLYKYDGTAEGAEWNNHKDGNFEDAFVNGRGYLASYETLDSVALSGYLYNKDYFDFTEVTYTEGKDFANFHLLGNPFPFNMDMSRATAEGMATGYAVVNAEGNYEYLTSGTVAMGDGFFVQAIAEEAAFSYDHKNVPTRSSRQASSINVIASGKAGKDNVIINFAGQSEGFNKLQNFNDEIATVFVANNGKRYGIANVDENVSEVELSFVASQMGNYSISLDINGEFEEVTLVDRFAGIETNMLLENEYNFTATSRDNANRFVVKLDNRQQTTDNSQFVYQSGEELILSIEGSVQIIDMLGRVVYSNEHSNGDNRINVSEFNNAAYVVRVVNAEGVKSQKVVIY